MPRPRTHDPGKALDRAMQLFWSQGFRGTSVQDIVDGCRVQRYGIYQSFGSKEELFLAAIDRYQATVVERIVAPLTRPGAGLPAIRRVLDSLVQLGSGAAGAKGCFICNTSGELGGAETGVATRTERYLATLRSAFLRALTGAHLEGMLRAGVDLPIAADHLTGLTVALCTLSRMPGARGVMENMVIQTLRGLSATGE